jgi:hypothetical protein
MARCFGDSVHAGREGWWVRSGKGCAWLRHGRRSYRTLRGVGGASRSLRDGRRGHVVKAPRRARWCSRRGSSSDGGR